MVNVIVSMTCGVAQSFLSPLDWSTVEETKNISTGNRAKVENTKPSPKIVTNVAKNSDSYLF